MTLVALALILAWLALPLLPALRELYRPQDASPLVLGVLGRPGVVSDSASTCPELLDAEELSLAGVLDERPREGATLRLLADCVAPGTLCAQNLAVVAPGARFRSLSAARIVVESSGPSQVTELEPVLAEGGARASPVWHPEQGWWRSPESVALRAGEQLHGALISAGDVELAHGATVAGDIKAAGDVRLAPGARVLGNIVAKNVHLARDCLVLGCVVAEARATVGAHATVGSAHASATVLAEHIELRPGCVVYGAVCAHHQAHARA